MLNDFVKKIIEKVVLNNHVRQLFEICKYDFIDKVVY